MLKVSICPLILSHKCVHRLFFSFLICLVAIKVLKKPKDVTSLLGGTASFELSLSHDNIPVKWMLKNQELKPSSNIKVLSERKAHKLVIQSVEESMAGEYIAVIGHLQCSAHLHVECTYNFYILYNTHPGITTHVA